VKLLTKTSQQKKKHIQLNLWHKLEAMLATTQFNSAASWLQYGRRRNANALRERGHIELIKPILAIITVEK